MTEILFRITAAIIAMASFFGFFMICVRRPNFFLGIVFAGILSGVFWVTAIFAMTGEKDVSVLLFIGIFTCVFGFITFFILWLKYDLVPRYYNRHKNKNEME